MRQQQGQLLERIGLHALDVCVDVPVRHEHIRPAVQVVIEKEASESERQQRRASNFRARRFVNEQSLSFVVIQRKHLVREIRDQYAGVSRMIVVGRVHTHARTRYAVFAERHARHDGFLCKRAVAVVAKKLVRLGVVGEQKVGPAVVVVIEHGDAESFRGRVAESRLLCDVFKRAVAAIVPQAHGRAFVRFRRAIRFAFAVERAIQVGLRRPLHVIGDHQIQMPVFVVVDPGGAGAEFLRPQQSRFLRHIGERAVAIVVKQMALPVSGDKKIVIAIIVIVAHRHAHPEEFDVEPRLVRHIGECAVMIVMIELRRRVFLLVPGPVHSVNQENVRPAVVVVIDEGHARSHRLGKIFLTERAVVVDEADSSPLRDVAELN